MRFLLYACDFDVEGLCTGFGHGHDQRTRPDLLRRGVVRGAVTEVTAPACAAKKKKHLLH